MTNTAAINEAIDALEVSFTAKYNQAIAAGATDEQAIKALRVLFLEGVRG